MVQRHIYDLAQVAVGEPSITQALEDQKLLALRRTVIAERLYV